MNKMYKSEIIFTVFYCIVYIPLHSLRWHITA